MPFSKDGFFGSLLHTSAPTRGTLKYMYYYYLHENFRIRGFCVSVGLL